MRCFDKIQNPALLEQLIAGYRRRLTVGHTVRKLLVAAARHVAGIRFVEAEVDNVAQVGQAEVDNAVADSLAHLAVHNLEVLERTICSRVICESTCLLIVLVRIVLVGHDVSMPTA